LVNFENAGAFVTRTEYERPPDEVRFLVPGLIWVPAYGMFAREPKTKRPLHGLSM
jgi:hypothetical protein